MNTKLPISPVSCIVSLAVLLSFFSFDGLGATQFGPYTVTRTIHSPAGSGLACLGDSLYVLGGTNIYRLNATTGTQLNTWGVGSIIGYSGWSGEGIYTDGTSTWIASRGPGDQDYIHQTILGSSSDVTLVASRPCKDPMDLTMVNGNFAYPQYWGPIRVMGWETGELRVLPSQSTVIYGLTYDGQYLLAGDGVYGRLYRMSPQTGTVYNIWQASNSGIWGLAWDQPSQTLYIGTGGDILVAVVPEPATGTLVALGGLLLFLFRKPSFFGPDFSRSASNRLKAGIRTFTLGTSRMRANVPTATLGRMGVWLGSIRRER